jgi:ClpP class serine protease
MATKKKTIGKHKPSFDKSPWHRVSIEVTQGQELRKPLIEKIEGYFNAKVIVYFNSFNKEQGMINDTDAEMIENILSSEHISGKIILIINSAGGFGLAAERIVNVCRAYSKNEFEVVVPHMAKSAATLICFGASCIHMSPTSELGPVDPQVSYTDDNGTVKWISAEEYVNSYQDLMDKAISGEAKRIEALIQQLSRYDSRYIEQLKSAQSLAESIIKKNIEDFLVHKKTSSHGRMITMEEAKESGLNIKPIELRSDLWGWIWELFIRADWVVSSRSNKILESSKTSLSA